MGELSEEAARYLMVLRDSGEYPPGLSAEDVQRILERYRAWSSRVAQSGRLTSGDKLRDGEGRINRRDGSRVVVTDGPFVETKEVIGGYFPVEAGEPRRAAEYYRRALALPCTVPEQRFMARRLRDCETASAAPTS